MVCDTCFGVQVFHTDCLRCVIDVNIGFRLLTVCMDFVLGTKVSIAGMTVEKKNNNMRYLMHMGGSRGGQGIRTPLKNHKNIGFLSNTGPNAGPDLLKNHSST